MIASEALMPAAVAAGRYHSKSGKNAGYQDARPSRVPQASEARAMDEKRFDEEAIERWDGEGGNPGAPDPLNRISNKPALPQPSAIPNPHLPQQKRDAPKKPNP